MKRALVVSAIFASVFGAAIVGAQSKSVIVERVLVRVNGEILTQSHLTQKQTDAIRERNRENQRMTDAAVMKLVNDVTPDVLVDAVDEMLLSQYGQELGAKFTDTEFNTALDQIKKENNLDDAGLKQAMLQEGLTMEQLRVNFERAFLIQVVQRQEVLRRMQITEEELRQYYNGHREELVTPATVTLREITVNPLPDAAATKAKAEAIRARALAGESFSALAQEVSDSATKPNGGLIGALELDDIAPALKATIEKLGPGDVTEPMGLARGGYQIIQVEAREQAALQPFDKIRDRIEQGIRGERLGGEMAKIVSRLRTQAVIEWKDDNLKKIYQQRLTERAAAPPRTRR